MVNWYDPKKEAIDPISYLTANALVYSNTIIVLFMIFSITNSSYYYDYLEHFQMTKTYHHKTYISKILIVISIIFLLFYLLYTRPQSASSDTPSSKPLDTKAQISVTDSVFSSIGNNSYKIVAQNVTQNNDGLYILNNISGSYNFENGNQVYIEATSGDFDGMLEKAKLEKDAKVTFLGYDLESALLDMNLKNYSVSSPTNVLVKGTSGTINADSFETTQKLNQITFHGNVKADFVLHNSPDNNK